MGRVHKKRISTTRLLTTVSCVSSKSYRSQIFEGKVEKARHVRILVGKVEKARCLRILVKSAVTAV